MTELGLNGSGAGRAADLIRQRMTSLTGRSGRFRQRRLLIIKLLLLLHLVGDQVLRIGAVILLANDQRLPIQEVLVPLTTIGVVRIREIPWYVLPVDHLDALGLAELNVLLLLLLQS